MDKTDKKVSLRIFLILLACLGPSQSFGSHTNKLKSEFLGYFEQKNSENPSSPEAYYFPSEKRILSALAEFPPTEKARLGDFDFYFSDSVEIETEGNSDSDRARRFYFMYSINIKKTSEKKLVLVVRSRSFGFKVVSAVLLKKQPKGQPVLQPLFGEVKESGGEFRSSPSIAQESSLDIQLEQTLIDRDIQALGKPRRRISPEVLNQYFSPDAQKKIGILNEFAKQTRIYKPVQGSDEESFLDSFQSYPSPRFIRQPTQKEAGIGRDLISGIGKPHEDLGSYFKTRFWNTKFFPKEDFKYYSVYHTNHLLLSKNLAKKNIVVRVFDIPFAETTAEMHISVEKDLGVIWISRFQFKGSRVNGFGVRNVVINTGSLTADPVMQANLLPNLENLNLPSVNREYVLFAPILDLNALINYFRGIKGIEKNYLKFGAFDHLKRPYIQIKRRDY